MKALLAFGGSCLFVSAATLLSLKRAGLGIYRRRRTHSSPVRHAITHRSEGRMHRSYEREAVVMTLRLFIRESVSERTE